MVVSCARPPLLPPLLLLECALEPPTTRAKIHSHANLAHSVTAIDSSTTVRHRRQHCWGAPILVSEDARVPDASLSNNAAQIASVKSRRAPTPSADDSNGVVPAAGTSERGFLQPGIFFSSFLFFDGENARFQRRSRRPWSEFGDGNRPSSAVSLNRDIKLAMGVRAPNAASINHGPGACALRDPSQTRVAQQ